MYAFKSLLILLASAATRVSGDDPIDAATTSDLLSKVVDWACHNETNGGWISPKVEIRSIGNSGLSGIFAKETLSKDEVVLDLPWQLLLRPPTEHSSYCQKLEHVRRAITKQPPEMQTPYERYLATRTKEKPPYYWSHKSKALLQELMVGFTSKGFFVNKDREFQETCDEESTAGHMDAMMLLQTRGEGEGIDLLAPIGDLLNHRNGNHTNVDPQLTDGVRYQIITTRAVKADEQLQNSYNQCKWCRMYRNPKRSEDYYVTPQLFEVYGFVELTPQRWIIPSKRLFFDIVTASDETTTATSPEGEGGREQLKAKFVVKPSRQGLAFLKGRLHRLEGFREKHQDRTDLPTHELEALLSFHDAIITAFTLAVEAAADGNTSEYVWKMPKNKWYWEYN